MSLTIQYIIDQGVPQETIIFLLMLPVVVTVIAFARQIIGIKGFGIYTPLIITFAFLATGLKYGLAFFVAILLVGTLVRLFIRKFRLLYLPRMAITLTIVALVILMIFFFGASTQRLGLINASVFAVLIMITLVEKFLAAQIERGGKGAVFLTLETLFLSIVCYWLASWAWLQNTALNFPFFLIVITILINIFLGKWTGLRLTEYFRFSEIIKNIEVPKKKRPGKV
ncbi:MAG: 7TM domain-containing protein [Patescibacteria group bacterium]